MPPRWVRWRRLAKKKIARDESELIDRAFAFAFQPRFRQAGFPVGPLDEIVAERQEFLADPFEELGSLRSGRFAIRHERQLASSIAAFASFVLAARKAGSSSALSCGFLAWKASPPPVAT